MEITSGEILYRANDIGSVGQALHPDISEDFWLFLDITKATMGTTNSEEIAHTGKAISASVEAYILKLRHRILTVRKAVELMKSQILNEIEFQNQRITSHLLEQQSRFDADVLQLVLQYYAIIQHEIATSRTKLLQENSEKDLLCKQAAILRDIRLFAYHLMVESRGKLGFTLLSPESQQFVRCVKAVMDNINNDVFQMANADALRTQIKVLNVFKLQNSFLSGKLQAASERVMNGKIKGLFCCLPQEQFYSFSVFGLYAQSLPYKANPSLQTLAGEIFSTAWFHTEPPAGAAQSLHQRKEVASALKVAGTAANLSVQRVANLNSAAPSGASKASRSAPHVFRFSRYSTISNLQDLSGETLQGGVFLALCRVLVVQQLTVANPIVDADIMAALQQGCDCIYSTATEEYVLIQPKFVLPEFFMHVQFPRLDRASASPAASGGSTVVPPMLALSNAPSGAAAGAGTTGRRDQGPGAPRDSVFPLENLLLHNAVCEQETKSASPGNSKVMYEADAAEGIHDPLNAINPHQSLMRKQVIVESLQKAVQNFRGEHDVALMNYVKGLAGKLEL